jgi:hypothetical protein
VPPELAPPGLEPELVPWRDAQACGDVADDRGDDGDENVEGIGDVEPAFREMVLTYTAMHDLEVQLWKQAWKQTWEQLRLGQARVGLPDEKCRSGSGQWRHSAVRVLVS